VAEYKMSIHAVLGPERSSALAGDAKLVVTESDGTQIRLIVSEIVSRHRRGCQGLRPEGQSFEV